MAQLLALAETKEAINKWLHIQFWCVTCVDDLYDVAFITATMALVS